MPYVKPDGSNTKNSKTRVQATDGVNPPEGADIRAIDGGYGVIDDKGVFVVLDALPLRRMHAEGTIDTVDYDSDLDNFTIEEFRYVKNSIKTVKAGVTVTQAHRDSEAAVAGVVIETIDSDAAYDNQF